jgi:putative Mg2+ transporter-C (MgtC) family protein
VSPPRDPPQVCTGCGFIGAGVIARGSARDPVRGVTTACAVWVSAALGVCSATGMPMFALYATGVTVSILRVSRWYAGGRFHSELELSSS